MTDDLSKINGTDAASGAAPSDADPSSDERLAQERERYLRLAAEFENYKKRAAREMEMLASASADRILMQTLDVLDNFERALDTTRRMAQNGQLDTQKLFDSLSQGAEMIHQQLSNILKSHGVQEIAAEGKLFDPAQHEATLQIDSDQLPEDHVAQVLTKGYARGGRILRHAKVGVTKKKENESPDGVAE